MSKKSKVLLTLLLAIALCLSSFATAFAALDENGALLGTENNPAQAAITKILQMPIGTNVPAATFEFEVVETRAFREVGGWYTPVSRIAGGTFTLTYPDAKMVSTTNGGITTVVLETEDIFKDVVWPHAGMYEYEITEIPNTNSAIDANTDHESLTYSPAKYTLTVYVKESTSTPGTYYIYAIGTYITDADNGDQTEGEKVDPTPGGGDEYDYSQMIFTNTYVKTNGPDKPDIPEPEKPGSSTLNIIKTVTGAYGDKTIYFSYTMSVTAPSLIPAADVPPYYRAYVVETIAGTATVVTSTSNAASSLIDTDAGGAYIKVFTSASTAFKLKDGQKLVFIDTPVGTSYTVSEAGTTGYKATLVVTDNSVAEAPIFGGGGTTSPVSGAGVGATGKWVGEAANSAAFTNERDDVTPTGLNLSNLPFLGLILLALGAVAVFVMVKFRKRKSYN